MKKVLLGITLLSTMSAHAINGDYLGSRKSKAPGARRSAMEYVYKVKNENKGNVCIATYNSIDQQKLLTAECTASPDQQPQMQMQQSPQFEDRNYDPKAKTKIGPVVDHLGTSTVRNHNVISGTIAWDVYTIEKKSDAVNCLNIVTRSEDIIFSGAESKVEWYAEGVMAMVRLPFNALSYAIRGEEDYRKTLLTYKRKKSQCWNVD